MTPDTAGANLTRTQGGPIEDGEEQRSNYSLASEAAKELRKSLKGLAQEQGYGLEVQITYGRNRDENRFEPERQLDISAWALGRGGELVHPSHIRALIEGLVPSDTYQNFRVRTLIAEPEVFEQIGYKLGPERKPIHLL